MKVNHFCWSFFNSVGFRSFLFLVFLLHVGVAAQAETPFFFEKLNQLSDNAAGYLINKSDADIVDVTLDVGDRIRGVFQIETIEDLTNAGGIYNLLDSGQPTELTAIFDITLVQKTAIGSTPYGAKYQYIFGPTPIDIAWADIPGPTPVSGTMIRFYEDTTKDFTRLLDGSSDDGDPSLNGADIGIGPFSTENLIIKRAINGSPFWDVGFTGIPNALYSEQPSPGIGEGWVAESIDNVLVLRGIVPPANGGTANVALNLTTNFLGPQLGPVSSTFGGTVDLNGSTNFLGIQNVETPFDFFNNVDFVIFPTLQASCLEIEKQIWDELAQEWQDADTSDTAVGVVDGVKYRLVVTNCGTLDLVNVRITDPELLIDYTLQSLPVGGDPVYLTEAEIPALSQPGRCEPPTTKENIAYATVVVDGQEIQTNDSAWLKCLCIDIQKEVSDGTTWQPADNETDAVPITDVAEYRLLVSNCGAVDFSNVAVEDIDLGIAVNIGPLGTGESQIIDSAVPGFENLFKLDRCNPLEPPSNKLNTATATGYYDDKTVSDNDLAWVACTPCAGVVGDFVWDDLNQNGIQDSGEPGIADVPVTLTGTNVYGTPINMTVNTDANGLYTFTGLCPGEYTVSVPTPAGYTPTANNAPGSTLVNDSNGSPATVTLSSDNNSDLTIDFGFYKLLVKLDVEKYVRVCTVTPEETDPGCAFHHHKHRDGDDHVKECDYNRDGKCDTGDDNYCDKNSYSCWNYDKYHCDYDHDGDCDSSDKSICDKNRDGSCNYHDKKSCFSHGDDEEENNFCDHDHDGDCDDAESGYQCTDWLDADDPTGPITPVCTEGNVSSCGKVYFQFVITNDGATPLSNITLTDSFYDVSSCELPASLISGESYTCEIGPLAPEAGQHTNTAIATGSYIGTEVTDSDDANYFGGTVEVGCVRSPGYWKNHSDAWPVESITIGGLEYTVEQAIGIMDKPVTKDKTYTMFPTLVAAKLDVLMGAESGCIDETITAADNWMNQYPVGSGVKGYSDAWKTGEPLSQKLDQYVNGQLCAAACDGNFPPTPFPSKPRIDIQKYTNGYDADVAPGPYVKVGESIEWKYVVKNKGDVALSEITVTDDKVDSITCPGSSLQPDESMTCSVTGIAIYGQYVNTGCVKGYTADGVKVSDCDKSHYYGTKTQSGCGTGTSGYWSKHSGAWPLWSVTVGGTSYSKDKAMWLISKSGFTDKTYAMFSALVAAKLNVKTGTNSDCISDTINAAEAWMKTYSLGCGVKENSTAWTSSGKSLYQKLITYNNGLLCAPHRDSITTNYTSWWGTEKKNLVCSDED